MRTYICLSSRRFLTGVFCLEGFSGVVFVRSPSVRIHPLQQKAKTSLSILGFICMEIFSKCDVTCYWIPSSCHKLSHLLGPPPTSSVTYFMDGPRPTSRNSGSSGNDDTPIRAPKFVAELDLNHGCPDPFLKPTFFRFFKNSENLGF